MSPRCFYIDKLVLFCGFTEQIDLLENGCSYTWNVAVNKWICRNNLFLFHLNFDIWIWYTKLLTFNPHRICYSLIWPLGGVLDVQKLSRQKMTNLEVFLTFWWRQKKLAYQNYFFARRYPLSNWIYVSSFRVIWHKTILWGDLELYMSPKCLNLLCILTNFKIMRE